MPEVKNPLLWCGRLVPNPGWHTDLHGHRSSELIVILRGRMQFWDEKHRLYQGAAGDVVLYPRHCRHQEKTDPRQPVETAYFGFGGPPPLTRISSAFDREGKVRTLAGWLLDMRGPEEKHAALKNLYLAAMLAEFERLHVAVPRNEALEKVRAFMREHYHQGVGVGDLAAAAGLSKFHFIRKYREWCREPPMESLRRLRVEEAKNLLATTSFPLKTIAPMTGFADEYHLSRCFKQHAGFPPGRYRKKFR
jgi:AraC-like DNA-binding protein